jgi:hypothetical protein
MWQVDVEADGLVPSGQSVKTNKANWALEDATVRMMQINGVALPISFRTRKSPLDARFFGGG